ncbi:MAG: inositol monophosphatase family protein [Alphaproteobacteria bacterium]|nr:inositol monophosphatase family protein [Alphaproteobacteria bacterium]
MSQSALMTVMIAAVRKAARGVVRDFGEIDKLQISKKGAANFVTNADLRTDKILIEELQKARPKFSFLTEESGVVEGADKKHRFVIDPIDGTTNFIHAIAYISISVGAQEMNAKGEWETIAGLVYDPIHDEMFTAEAKQGAYLNSARIRASSRREDLLLSTTAPRKTRPNFEQSLAAFSRIVAEDATVRCSGSAALDLAYVAAGRLDGMWYPRLNSWDMVAGALLVKEANGMVTALDGTPIITDGKGSVLASNGLIHKKLQGLLNA